MFALIVVRRKLQQRLTLGRIRFFQAGPLSHGQILHAECILVLQIEPRELGSPLLIGELNVHNGPLGGLVSVHLTRKKNKILLVYLSVKTALT